MTSILISTIRKAAESKPDAWLADVLLSGVTRGNRLEISTFKWNLLCLRHRQYGDAFKTIANPVANMLGLKPCAGCKKRGKAMNGGGKLV